MLATIILATIIISLISITGIIVLFRQKLEHRKLRPLISLAAGALLAVAFLDLLPEAIEESSLEPHLIFGVTLGSMLVFFLFERILHWHHCSESIHETNDDRQPRSHLAYLNLIGDALHNLIDGFLVAGAFLLDVHTGVVVTLAVIFHEIPQEISDFGVLLYAGWSKSHALLANFLVALTAVLGAVAFYFFGERIESAVPLMAAIAAGNFIYLAAADLIPELHHETRRRNVVLHTLWLLAGVAVIYLTILLVPHQG
ncbi:MAG: hypothetical protein A3J59_04725 [Candidatus Buchananbacteria bacterium RIFCSPHIGHO2_02_FULL_56_16]|uniref:ZIP zinc transporter n=1 Tax=Candidatus Buchananbacteria bacterium RIFCSPHIGHO2_02_FULL_56_16 TaxID=1797542 RepID=A0A1G1YCM3_9BACT|nr:MAG: hypothetical protein A3J59_04725 [Candidatus Buchananbacteria bacterium RIFCSPHIGHO2_02_FULL_56_16]